MNPNMRGEKLRGVFTSLGFKNVSSLLASGNIVFESVSKDSNALETKIEAVLFKRLKFHSTTIIRSEDEIKQLTERKPFGKKSHGRKTYLIVTFLKNRSAAKHGILCNVVDVSKERTPDFMLQIEKKFGKDITTRTWATIQKVADRMRA